MSVNILCFFFLEVNPNKFWRFPASMPVVGFEFCNGLGVLEIRSKCQSVFYQIRFIESKSEDLFFFLSLILHILDEDVPATVGHWINRVQTQVLSPGI